MYFTLLCLVCSCSYRLIVETVYEDFSEKWQHTEILYWIDNPCAVMKLRSHDQS